jgi:putative Holliday junction resolvase
MIIAAVDYGRRRIGIAATGEHGVVFPAAVIEQRSRKLSLEAVGRRLAELGAERVIVGWPLNMDGSAGVQAAAAEKFAAELRLTTGLTVDLFDERLSSYEARERLRAAPARIQRGKPLDAVAACVILESWVQSQKR